jgi:cytochrome c
MINHHLRGLNMRLNLICLISLLLLNACGEDKQQNSTPSATTPENAAPTTAATQTPTAEPTKPEAKESDTAPAQQQVDIPSQAKEISLVAVDDSNKESLALAKASGCLACHAVDKKAVGPAWKDVAKRYAEDPGAKAKLIVKVAKGGRGNWTEVVGNVAMPPYSPRVSAENIEALVDFVLSLDKE